MSGQGFPDLGSNKGRSIALNSASFDHESNDIGDNWHAFTAPIPGGCGDKGSPGKVNP